MISFTDFVHGNRQPYKGERLRNCTADDFAGRSDLQLHVGTSQERLAGVLLIRMSARGGQWHAVPYRMLRNKLYGYEDAVCILKRWQKQLPKIDGVTVGVFQDLRKSGRCSVFVRDGEHYLLPTPRLLSETVPPTGVTERQNGEVLRDLFDSKPA